MARWWAPVLALTAFVATPAIASADEGRDRKIQRAKKAKAKAKAKARAKAKAKARKAREARRKRIRHVPNMPDNWKWPPSRAMVAQGRQCRKDLRAAGVKWKRADREGKIATPIVVPSMTFGALAFDPTYQKPPFVMDCHLAKALAATAPKLADLGVREVRFSRIYGNTQVRTMGTTKNALSRHALGLAIDIRAFVDRDGREVIVERDYPLGDALLLGVEQALADSGNFRTVLTPKNDPKSHDDHFHLEVRVEYPDRPAS
jgi:hypothetical protein